MKDNTSPDVSFRCKMKKDIVSYARLRILDAKLALVENLSTVISTFVGLVLSIWCAFFAILLFTGALVYWLGIALNSYVWAFVITGAFYLILAILFFVLKGKLIANTMVRSLGAKILKTEDK